VGALASDTVWSSKFKIAIRAILRPGKANEKKALSRNKKPGFLRETAETQKLQQI
jgi:hypothetical protein